MWALTPFMVLVAGYAAVMLIAYAAQTSLLFPRSLVGPGPALPAAAERVALDTPDGERLHGVRIPPAVRRHRDPTLVLGFGGNAWNADAMAQYLHELYPETEVVVFHYRGYRPSTGKPTAAALVADALLVHDFAVMGRDQVRVVGAGFSIGSGVAAHLARHRQLNGLILVTPFDTLEQLARDHYPWLPVRLLLRHHLSPVEDLQAASAPVALIAAEQDTIVPAARTAPLRNVARHLILDRTISNVGHNEIYAEPEFTRAMRHAMRLIQQWPTSEPLSAKRST